MATILLVEDNEMNQDMLSRRLRRRGHEVLVADNGRDGVNLARSAKPDIILMDMSLPVLDGWEATKLLKTSQETQRIPVIALTAHALEEDREKALEAGCDDFETKPIRFNQLIEKIQSWLPKESNS